jgi:hypothetical protein
MFALSASLYCRILYSGCTDFEEAIPVTLIEALGLMQKRVQDEKTISAPGMKMDNTWVTHPDNDSISGLCSARVNAGDVRRHQGCLTGSAIWMLRAMTPWFY